MNATEQRFAQWVGEFSHELYGYALGLCHTRHQAEDLVQTTYLRAWRSIDQPHEPETARAWLYGILRREHARLHPHQRPECRDPTHPPEIPAPGRDTRPEAHPLLRQALAALAVEYREPLLLQVIGGFRYDEIGDLLGVSSSVVMTRLYRARQRLRRILAPEPARVNEQ